jgi:N6-adenosine-specific RNA methylase IME4
MKFQVIVADCPWGPEDKLKMSKVKRGAASNYSTLSISDLSLLRVKDISDPNGTVLVLWVLGSMLSEGLQIMKDWGFQQKQTFVWVKTKKEPLQNLKKSIRKLNPMTRPAIEAEIDLFDQNGTMSFGMGRLFRQSHEICLIGVNSTKIYKKLKSRSQRSVCFDENRGHSTKPELVQDYLDTMFPGCDKLELFGRRKRNGWVVVGNEICNGEDIRQSIDKLIQIPNASPSPPPKP